MKKKYQIPESGSRCLRTTLCAGSFPGQNGENVDFPSEEQKPGSEGNADARQRTNLLDL